MAHYTPLVELEIRISLSTIIVGFAWALELLPDSMLATEMLLVLRLVLVSLQVLGIEVSPLVLVVVSLLVLGPVVASVMVDRVLEITTETKIVINPI
jgi:uncharacterized membrane protein